MGQSFRSAVAVVPRMKRESCDSPLTLALCLFEVKGGLINCLNATRGCNLQDDDSIRHSHSLGVVTPALYIHIGSSLYVDIGVQFCMNANQRDVGDFVNNLLTISLGKSTTDSIAYHSRYPM